MLRIGTRLIGIGAFTALCLACGGGDDTATVERSATNANAESGSSEQVAPPEEDVWDETGSGATDSAGRSISLQPARPRSGQMIRAVIDHGGGTPRGHHFDYAWTAGDRKISGSSASIEVPDLMKGEEVRVQVRITDPEGEVTTLEAAGRIPNTPPRMQNLEIRPDQDPELGEVWRAVTSGDDADGDEVEFRYEWLVNGAVSDVEGADFPTRQLKRGDKVRLRVFASDGEDESRPAESGTIGIANAGPDITSTPPQLGSDGRFAYTIEASDPDGDSELKYLLVSGPEGMEIDDSGTVSWTPNQEQAGVHVVEVAVEDSEGSRTTQQFSLPIVLGGASESSPASPQP